MTSLREEIYKHLWMLTDNTRNNLTDVIIKDIEKRIDELLKESHKFQWDYVYALRQVNEILK